MEFFHTLICILVIAISAYFFFKRTNSKTGKVLTVVLPTIFLTPILYFVSTFWISNIARSVGSKKFDKENWFSEKSNRFKYSADINSSALIKDKTSLEVVNLLGEPDNETENVFHYNLAKGSWRNKYGFNPWMRIEFKDDTVLKHDTVWDD